jgi:hypothetical protein
MTYEVSGLYRKSHRATMRPSTDQVARKVPQQRTGSQRVLMAVLRGTRPRKHVFCDVPSFTTHAVYRVAFELRFHESARPSTGPSPSKTTCRGAPPLLGDIQPVKRYLSGMELSDANTEPAKTARTAAARASFTYGP